MRIKEGSIPTLRTGKSIRMRREEVEGFVRSGQWLTNPQTQVAVFRELWTVADDAVGATNVERLGYWLFTTRRAAQAARDCTPAAAHRKIVRLSITAVVDDSGAIPSPA